MNVEDQIEWREGWWWPKADTEAWVAIRGEVGDIDAICQFVPRRRVVVQAGGNCGMWVRRYSQVFEEVYTYEPDPVNWECLRRNIDGIPNVMKFNSAVGDKPGLTDIEVRWDVNRGANRLKAGDRIPVVRIDDSAGALISACDLLQLDVEGYEHLALLGAERTIKAFKPTIVLELKGHGEHYGYPDGATIDMLAGWGYRHVHTIRTDHIFTPA